MCYFSRRCAFIMQLCFEFNYKTLSFSDSPVHGFFQQEVEASQRGQVVRRGVEHEADKTTTAGTFQNVVSAGWQRMIEKEKKTNNTILNNDLNPNQGCTMDRFLNRYRDASHSNKAITNERSKRSLANHPDRIPDKRHCWFLQLNTTFMSYCLYIYIKKIKIKILWWRQVTRWKSAVI